MAPAHDFVCVWTALLVWFSLDRESELVTCLFVIENELYDMDLSPSQMENKKAHRVVLVLFSDNKPYFNVFLVL